VNIVVAVSLWQDFFRRRIFHMSSAAEEAALEEDRQRYPGCFHSHSESSNCSMVNGAFKCKKLREIFRRCPNHEQNGLVFRKSEISESEDSDSMAAEMGDKILGEFIDQGSRMFGSMVTDQGEGEEELFVQIPSLFARMMPGFESFMRGMVPESSHRPPGWESRMKPPHASSQGPTTQGNTVGKKATGPDHYRQYEGNATEL
jgi:hypothetical protein